MGVGSAVGVGAVEEHGCGGVMVWGRSVWEGVFGDMVGVWECVWRREGSLESLGLHGVAASGPSMPGPTVHSFLHSCPWLQVVAVCVGGAAPQHSSSPSPCLHTVAASRTSPT